MRSGKGTAGRQQNALLGPFPGAASYSAAKAGVIALTRSMAVDYAPAGVTVNAIAPGLILTDMTRGRLTGDPRYRALMLEGTPLGRPGRPEDVAGAAVFLASPDADFVTGHVLTVDGGWSVGKFRPVDGGEPPPGRRRGRRTPPRPGPG